MLLPIYIREGFSWYEIDVPLIARQQSEILVKINENTTINEDNNNKNIMEASMIQLDLVILMIFSIIY